MMQGGFVEMAVNQNTVLTVHLGMVAISGIGLEITCRGGRYQETGNKPLHIGYPVEQVRACMSSPQVL